MQGLTDAQFEGETHVPVLYRSQRVLLALEDRHL